MTFLHQIKTLANRTSSVFDPTYCHKMKASVRFANTPEFCATPFYNKKGFQTAPNTPDILSNALGFENTPVSYTPSVRVEDDDDRVKMAGRTPHNKLSEAANKMALFKQTLISETIVTKYISADSPLVLQQENRANISIVSPSSSCNDSANSAENSGTPYSASNNANLFGFSDTDSPNEKAEFVKVDPISIVLISPEEQKAQGKSVVRFAPTQAEKISHMPAQSENKCSRAKRVNATPYFERPKVVKGTPYASKSYISDISPSSSADENESPNRMPRGRSYSSPVSPTEDTTPLVATAAAMALCDNTLDNIDLEEVSARSLFQSPPQSGSAEQYQKAPDAESVGTDMLRPSPAPEKFFGLVPDTSIADIELAEDKQLPIESVIASTSAVGASAFVAPPKARKGAVPASPMRPIAPAKPIAVKAPTKQAIVAAPMPTAVLAQPAAASRSLTTFTPSSSTTSLLLLGSPAMLKRAGGVAKGKGPSGVRGAVSGVVQTKPPVVKDAVAETIASATTTGVNKQVHVKRLIAGAEAASPIGQPAIAIRDARAARKLLSYSSGKKPQRPAAVTVETEFEEVAASSGSADKAPGATPSLEKVSEEPQSSTNAVSAGPQMCNVSIQCSSFLDLTGMTADTTATADQSRTRCTSADENSQGPFTLGDAPPAAQSHHSPMFTSYYRTQHDSDSEVDDFECGLSELLPPCDSAADSRCKAATSAVRKAVTASTPLMADRSSSLACSTSSGERRNLSIRSTSAVLGSARRCSPGERFTVEEDEDDDAGEDQQEVSLATLISGAHKSALPARHAFNADECSVIGESTVKSKGNTAQRTTTTTTSTTSGRGLYEYSLERRSELSFSFVDATGDDYEESVKGHSGDNLLDATDAAVKFTNESIYEDEDEDEKRDFDDCEVSLLAGRSDHALQTRDHSAMCDAETTMTVDDSPLVRTLLDRPSLALSDTSAPRLAIRSMARSMGAVPDMKEIGMTAAPGRSVTVEMQFANRHKKPLVLRSQAIPVRFETAPGSVSSSDSMAAAESTTVTRSGTVVESDNYFYVHPAELTVLPGDSSPLFITFQPTKAVEGVYSGALRIKSGHKSFTILLRGEAVSPTVHGIAEPQHSNVKEQRQKTLQQRIQRLSHKSETRTANAPTAVSVSVVPRPQEMVRSAVTVSPETVQILRSQDPANQNHEAFVDVTCADARDVTVSVSSSLLRLARSRYDVSVNSTARVRVMLDTASPAFQSFCRRFLASTSSASRCYHLGFVTVRCAGVATTEEEFNVDVAISRATCQALRDQHLAMSASMDASSASYLGGVSAIAAVPAALEVSSLQKEAKLWAATPTETLANRTASVSSAVTQVNHHSHDRNHRPRVRSFSGDSSVATVGRDSNTRSRVVQQRQQVNSTDKSDKNKAGSEARGGGDIYFRRESVQCGAMAIGSLTRACMELCNATSSEVTVLLGDVPLPFVLLHNQVTIKPRSYVRVPVRFLPTRAGDYCEEVVAQTEDGSHHCTVFLMGCSYA